MGERGAGGGEERGVSRLLIDSVGGLAFASPDSIRFRKYIYSLVQRCSRQGISVLMTMETVGGVAYASFHQTLIPGTQRVSPYALDGLMTNQTVVRPDTVSLDIAGASEIVVALAWTLGYRYAPRSPTGPTSACGGSTQPPTTGRSKAWPQPDQHHAHHQPRGAGWRFGEC